MKMNIEKIKEELKKIDSEQIYELAIFLLEEELIEYHAFTVAFIEKNKRTINKKETEFRLMTGCFQSKALNNKEEYVNARGFLVGERYIDNDFAKKYLKCSKKALNKEKLFLETEGLEQ